MYFESAKPNTPNKRVEAEEAEERRVVVAKKRVGQLKKWLIKVEGE